MTDNLAIVESPSKCKKIASFLGPGWRVIATFGHIRALEESIDAIGLDTNFEPKYKFIKEKTKVMKQLLDAAEGAGKIYLCADDDREGEAIAYSVACLLKRDPLSFPRAVFREITEKAVKDAIANPRKLDMNRVYAQQARSVLDMMVGFTISPLLWKYVARSLSAGRCQTPALRLVCDKEASIKTHVSNASWIISGKFDHLGKVTMQDELEDQESVLNYLENIYTGQTATVKSITEKPWTASAPKALITSTLQQEASALHSLPPKEVMRIAQSLYEAGHITYMRTDSHVLSTEAVDAAHEWVKGKYGVSYIGEAQVRSKTKANAQEAHEAIRPTHMEVDDLTDEWDSKHRKVYSLIWRRAVQSTMANAKGTTHTTTLTLDNDEDQFIWSTSFRKTTFDGWQVLGKTAMLDDEEEEDHIHPLIKVGAKVKWERIDVAPKRSKPSPRYTEATLIRDLEKKGVGRPSTFASLVDVLFDKEYIQKKDIPGIQITNVKYILEPNEWPAKQMKETVLSGKEVQKIVPTPLGESVIQFCMREFPQLFAYDFTSSMEKRLDDIAEGSCQWKTLCSDTWNSYKDKYTSLKDSASKPSQSEKVREFTNGLKAVQSKKGPLLVQEKDVPVFYSFPDIPFEDITEEIARNWIKKLTDDTIFGEWKGQTVYKKKGPYGFYIEYAGKRVPYLEGDTMETLIQKLEKGSASTSKAIGQYIFAVGQYGPYMYKAALKTKVFLSVPSTVDMTKISAADADILYKRLSQEKKTRAASGRGRGRGRGGGQGQRQQGRSQIQNENTE
jgi:DNA topoisomerase-1